MNDKTKTRALNPEGAALEKGKVMIGGKVLAPKKDEPAKDPHAMVKEKDAKIQKLEKELKKTQGEEKVNKYGVKVRVPGRILFGKDKVIDQIQGEIFRLADLTGETPDDIAARAGLPSELTNIDTEDLNVILAEIKEHVFNNANSMRRSIREKIKAQDKLNGAY